MVQKPEIRTWHRKEFAEGKKENIPAHVLALLESEKKEQKKETKKDKPEE